MIKIKSEQTLYDVADLFKVFSDSTRLRIMYALLDKERSVNVLAQELKMNQSAISHQLRVLKNARLIKNRKQGKEVYYSLADEHVVNVLSQGIEHIEE